MDDCAYPRNVGRDVILRKGEQLVVCSKMDMDEWEVGDMRKTAIYINDEYWFIIGKQFSSTGEVRYLLDPWHDAMREIPRRVIRYDENYVSARDEVEKARRLESSIYPILHILRGLIGFLPSGVKGKIEDKFGVSARGATIISIFIELLLFFVLCVWLIYAFGVFYASQQGRFIYAAAVIEALYKYIPAFLLPPLILLIDIAMRYGSYLREEVNPLGAFEWVWAWIWRRLVNRY